MYEPSEDEKTLHLEFKCVYCGIVNRRWLDFKTWDGGPLVHVCSRDEQLDIKTKGCGRYFVVDVLIEPQISTKAIVSAKDFKNILAGVKKKTDTNVN